MTFHSETVRLLFHQLPIDTQIFYSTFESQLAENKKCLHIDGVMVLDDSLEVIIRISENFNFPTSDSRSAQPKHALV